MEEVHIVVILWINFCMRMRGKLDGQGSGGGEFMEGGMA